MILFKRATDLREHLEKQRKKGKKIGFAPTMGALHDGHISLVEASRKENDLSAVSIFVNPTQFNDPADYAKYPVTLEKDISLLEAAGCDVLFLPPVEEMYPSGQMLKKKYELGYLESLLEGSFRPGHFQAVCQIVHRLLEVVQPDNLYMGQKDYQQCMVVKKLLELTGLGNSVELHISPTLREKSGLAMIYAHANGFIHESGAAIPSRPLDPSRRSRTGRGVSRFGNPKPAGERGDERGLSGAAEILGAGGGAENPGPGDRKHPGGGGAVPARGPDSGQAEGSWHCGDL
ncbi:MAG: hypothetical protein EOP86_08905 [Verrucomicrobiaceae bacterium]|nr:MAG: hypothetical protein EOP86_08905 [Verrucomicrobiaceae bacterium]